MMDRLNLYISNTTFESLISGFKRCINNQTIYLRFDGLNITLNFDVIL